MALVTSRRVNSALPGPVSLKQIERAATTLFSERSYSSVGMRDISDAVGLLPGSLYSHIRSKEALFAGIVERGYKLYVNTLAPIASTEDAPTKLLELLIIKFMQLIDEDLDHAKVTFLQWSYLTGNSRQRVTLHRRRFKGIFRDILTTGVSTGEFATARDPDIAVQNITGLLTATLSWYDPKGRLNSRAVGTEIARTIINGIGK